MRTIFFLFLLLPSLLSAQLKFVSGAENSLKKNEEAACVVTTADQHTYFFTAVVSHTSVNNYTPPDKITVYHYDAEMKLVSKAPFKKPTHDDSDVEFVKAFLLGDKIMVVGKAQNTRSNTAYLLLTELDRNTLAPSGKVTELFQYTFDPDPYFPHSAEYAFRQSPSGTSLAIKITFDKQAVSKRSGNNAEYRFIVTDGSPDVSSFHKRKKNEDDLDYAIQDFVVTDEGHLLVLETEAEHVAVSWNNWNDESTWKKQVRAAANASTLITRYEKGKDYQRIKLIPAGKGRSPEKCMLFRSGGETFVSGLLSFNAATANDSTSFIPRLFVQPLSFAAKELLIEEKNTAEINEKLYDDLFEVGNIAQEDKDRGVYGEFNFVFAGQLPEGGFILAGEVFVDRTFPPFEQMKNDKRYTITQNGMGGTSISGPPEFSRTYNQAFIIRFDPAAGKLTGTMIPREYKTPKPASSEKELRGPYASSLQVTGSGKATTFLFMDSGGGGRKLCTADIDGTITTTDFLLPADHRLLCPGEHSAKVLILHGAKAYRLMRIG